MRRFWAVICLGTTLSVVAASALAGEGELAPWTRLRKGSAADLRGLSNWDLTLVRNEIYARHGRPFQNAAIRAYFRPKPWYHADSRFTEGRLNRTERYNADFIRRYQQAASGGPATSP